MTKLDPSPRTRGKVHLRSSLFCLALLLGWLGSARVRAEGEQLMPGGAAAIGRGGATAARPYDNMAMLHNPAGLVDLSGDQVLLSFDTSIDNFCVRPYGYYGWGVYLTEDSQGNTNNPDDHRSEFGDPASSRYGTRHLDKVCNSSLIGPLPQLALSFHVTPRLSVAFGFVANAFVTGAQWGGKDGTIQTEDGPRPTPTRYQIVRQEASFGLNPTGSIAYRATPWLSVGATLQVLMGSVNSYQMIALRAGTSPANDMLAKVHAVDLFMPALTLGAYVKPSRRLRFAGTFNWSEGLNGRGDITFTTNYFHQGAVGSEALPLQNDPVKLKHIRLAQPWTATLAARYVQPLAADVTGADPLKDERFDVELDGSFVANRSTSGGHVDVADDFTLEFRRADGTPQMPLAVKAKDLDEINVERHVMNLWVVRLGGSLTVIPNKLGVSAGGFFQTRSVEPSYASLDNYGFRRVGLGLGVNVRVGKFDLMAAYSHIFQETITVAPPDHEPRTDATDAPESGFDTRIYRDGRLSERPNPDPAAPSPKNADGVAKVTQTAVFESDDLRRRVVNAGRYTAGFDVVSVGATYHF